MKKILSMTLGLILLTQICFAEIPNELRKPMTVTKLDWIILQTKIEITNYWGRFHAEPLPEYLKEWMIRSYFRKIEVLPDNRIAFDFGFPKNSYEQCKPEERKFLCEKIAARVLNMLKKRITSIDGRDTYFEFYTGYPEVLVATINNGILQFKDTEIKN